MDGLAAIYKELDFQAGDLLRAAATPPSRVSRKDWVEKGEWLASAERAGADSVFFVDNNPVIVFARCGQELADEAKAFNRVWSLARPRILFLASPGEITVYDLAQKPVDEKDSKSWKNLRHLELLQKLSAVASQLQAFHRDNIESGRVFGDERFGDLNDRADKALIRDLKTVRRALMQNGLSGEKLRYAHSLIGRSIFIRYLEDRGVLDEGYFLSVAGQVQGWTGLLRNPSSRPGLDFTDIPTFYPKVLQDKDFTYAFFERLSRDFNGDMFPDVETEREIVEQSHLHRIQGLLYGDPQGQRRLFFHAYRFNLVPLDLISAIYEEFYRSAAEDEKRIEEERKKRRASSKARDNGAYYTPPELAEFVLSRVLTPEALRGKPRVLDPACGSGIFLVEAFRRMVRYERHKKQEPLTFDELRTILRDQIAGIEVEEEAARIAAFSLYLAMLHYLDPPAIREHIQQGNKLPGLLASKNNTSPNCFHSILCANTFDAAQITSTARWKERFGDRCADVLVGNPPWGAPGRKADPETKTRQRVLLRWCTNRGRPIGDNEPSQAFLWRALDFLKPGGKAGMLVSAGVLFKHGTRTQTFRRRWLSEVKLREVFNFAHVRKFFFTGSNSPFVSLLFEKGRQRDTPVYYWSAKQTAEIKRTQAVLLSQHDLNILRDVDLRSTNAWKTHWLATCFDYQFLRQLMRHDTLAVLSDADSTGRGLEIASKTHEATQLQSYRFLPNDSFSRYDRLRLAPPPKRVYRFGCLGLYSGCRILFQRGIQERESEKGVLVARYADERFCFTNAIHGAKLLLPTEPRYKTLIGILWSSLARYFFFMTSSNWGLWHHEVHLDELLQLPVVLDESHPATQRVVRIVDRLRDYHPEPRDSEHPHGVPNAAIQRKRRQWEQQLDEAVFDLYDLTEDQRDLIRDCCEVTLPFFYKPLDSIGAELAVGDDTDLQWMEQYARAFCGRWNTYLPDDQEMRAELHVGAHGNMVAVEFYPADKGDPWDLTPKYDWQYVLEQLNASLPQEMGTSQIILDGLAYAVFDDSILVIKRNIKRLWTRSLAREDAGSTLTRRMIATMPNQGGKE